MSTDSYCWGLWAAFVPADLCWSKKNTAMNEFARYTKTANRIYLEYSLSELQIMLAHSVSGVSLTWSGSLILCWSLFFCYCPSFLKKYCSRKSSQNNHLTTFIKVKPWHTLNKNDGDIFVWLKINFCSGQQHRWWSRRQWSSCATCARATGSTASSSATWRSTWPDTPTSKTNESNAG